MAEITVTDNGNIIEINQGGDLTVVLPVENNIEIEQIKFLQLVDTPSTYDESAGKVVKVNEDGSGLIFGKSYSSFLDLDDTPRSYENAEGQLVVVNSRGNGLRFINYDINSALKIEYFYELADVPSGGQSSYIDKAGYLVAIDSNESGLTYISKDSVLPVQTNVHSGFYKYPAIVVNEKGIITNVSEGQPFEFEPFTESELLVGDGTSTPVSLSKGLTRQVLWTSSNETNGPEWAYLDRLLSSSGKNLLIVENLDEESDTGVLQIINSRNDISLLPDNNQAILLGTQNNPTIVKSTLTVDHDSILKGNLIIQKSLPTIEASNLRIMPGTGTVGLAASVDLDDYDERIQDSDFITKSWYNKKQTEERSIYYTRTDLQTITTNQITFNCKNGDIVMEIILDISSQFNKEAKLRIVDNLNQVLFDPEDCPYLDYEDLRVFLNIPVTSDTYKIYCSILDYAYGQGTIFMNYFKGNE